MNRNRVYGIDLGTTYSCIASVDEHMKPVVARNSEGEATTPSVVFFENASNIVVGQGAKERAVVDPERVVHTVKRAMGNEHWAFTADGESYRPQDVSAFILKRLVRDAEAITGDQITDVVITCPAYFNPNQKAATKQAGEIAGLTVRYVIPEPTAAALAYGIEQTEDQLILVYDLGGGTFDVTLMHIQGGSIDVLATEGDHELGGKDWDERIVSYLAETFGAETGAPTSELLEDREMYQTLLTDAENVKKRLSSMESMPVRVQHGFEKTTVTLTRATFDELTADLLERTLTLTRQLVQQAAGRGLKVDKILLVGGSTYMPQVQAAVRGEFADIALLQFDPNEAVAKGAALFGLKCELDDQVNVWLLENAGVTDLGAATPGQRQSAAEAVGMDLGLPGQKVADFVATDLSLVTPKSFGIVVEDRALGRQVVANLIHKNDSVPVTREQRFGTLDDGQASVELRCMENVTVQPGRAVEVADSTELGVATVTFARPLPEGSPISVTFSLSRDGLLSLKGVDLTTGGEIEAQFQANSVMSDEELERARRRASGLALA
jgi:molecular chaperone DnaK